MLAARTVYTDPAADYAEPAAEKSLKKLAFSAEGSAAGSVYRNEGDKDLRNTL